MSRRLPNGLVFVDSSASGGNIPTGEPQSPAATVDVRDGAVADPTGIWSGWLVVNGSVVISGTLQMKGLIYARDSFNYQGAGRISGAVVSQNVGDASSTIDPASAGNVAIVYDCADARSGGGTIPGRWTLKSGSYREVSGS